MPKIMDLSVPTHNVRCFWTCDKSYLKWFELKLTGLPICFFSGILGPMKLNSKERKFLISTYLPWVQSLKIQSEKLLTFRYEDNLHRSAADIREELGITKAPPLNF